VWCGSAYLSLWLCDCYYSFSIDHDTDNQDTIKERIILAVREHIGPVAAFKKVIFTPGLPKTRSGKIARGTLSKLADGKPFKVGTSAWNNSDVGTYYTWCHQGPAMPMRVGGCGCGAGGCSQLSTLSPPQQHIFYGSILSVRGYIG